MLKLLKKPYPYLFSTKRNLIIATVVGLFVSFSESVFVSGNNYIQLTVLDQFCIGITTFMSMMFVFEVLMKYLISLTKKENWIIADEIITICILIFFVSISNYAIFCICNNFPDSIFSFNFFLMSLFWTYVVGLIPTSVIIWINYNIILNRNLKASREYNAKLEQRLKNAEVRHENEKHEIKLNKKTESLKFDLDNLLFITAEGNYIEIFSEENNTLTKTLLRCPLQKIEEELNPHPYIVRVHRSYIVNSRKIISTSGTARDFVLHFNNTEKTIPVSRSKYKEFKQIFEL